MTNVRSLDQPRLLFQANLQPVQGSRFQPTGFPDLGAAEYQTAAGVSTLLVESAQSMANRLESVCWDEAEDQVVPALLGIPYVVVTLPDGSKTNSILEAHRLNSPYIEKSDRFSEIKAEVGFEKDAPFDRRRLAKALLKLDPNSLIHGIFLESVGGVVRLPRMLSAFVEATDVRVAPSGGVKFDRVQPASTGDSTGYGKAAEGYGNVPFHRDEYSAGEITAYFNFDLALLRGLGFGAEEEDFLFDLGLFKILAFLNQGLRLRTACDLEVVGDMVVRRPESWELPTLADVEARLRQRIGALSGSFNQPPVLEATYEK
ncbi:MAG: type I-U CRISPR-associated RAMP protein Csb1/Cas7u [Acidobacteriota bacterium]